MSMPLRRQALLLQKCPDIHPLKPAALAHFAFWYIFAQHFSCVDSKPLATDIGCGPTGRMGCIPHFMGHLTGRNRSCGQYRVLWFFVGMGGGCVDRQHGVVFCMDSTFFACSLGHRIPVPALPPQTFSHRATERHERFVDTHAVVGHVFFTMSGN